MGIYLEFLNESKIEDKLRNLPWGDFSKKFIMSIIGQITNKNKYVDWIIKSYADIASLPIPPIEKANKIATLLNIFEDKQNLFKEKDIMRYDLIKLLDAVENLKLSKTETKKQVLLNASEKVFEDNTYIVYHIKNAVASCILGKGTTWCISASFNNAFEKYSENKTVYFIFNKKLNINNPMYKVAVFIDDANYLVSLWDAGDNNFKDDTFSLWKEALPTRQFVYDNLGKVFKFIPSKT
jgi:hypothetical protein